MDSYSYVNLLPGNGTGQPPEDDAVWNDMSYDGNDVVDILNPTYVSSNTSLCNVVHIVSFLFLSSVAARCWRNMSISGTSVWISTKWGHCSPE